jgi:hypothetical protein
MQVDYKVIYEKTLQELRGVQREQFPFAFSKALNDTAFDVMFFYQSTVQSILEDPTPFTVKSMYVKKATKKTLSAEVGFKEFASKGTPAVKYMSHLQYGGERLAKRAEVLLRQKGHLEKTEWLIPTEHYRDKYGNVRRGQVQKMLSAVQSTLDTAAYSKGDKAKQFFIPSVRSQQHLGKHIYTRRGKNKMRMFMRIVNSVKYKPILRYGELCSAHADKVFAGNLQKAIVYAVGSAR